MRGSDFVFFKQQYGYDLLFGSYTLMKKEV